jgi:predicted amino acid racemase
MAFPYLNIDLDKIEANARAIVDLCGQHGVQVTGVTKVTCGHPGVASAMLRGGASSIADSRLENIHRLKNAGVETRYMLLRLPPLSGVEQVVESVSVSLNSELAVLETLSKAAMKRDRVHDVIIMVDLGDLREGVWPDDLVPFVAEALKLGGIRVIGLGTNLACFSGVLPDEDKLNQLVGLTNEIEQTFKLKLDCVSGLNSSGLELIAKGSVPKRVNHARIGEAIILGRETAHRKPWPGTDQDAFTLHAEVLEMKAKPSRPLGARGEDAFGELPQFEERGVRDRALLNVGREDIVLDGVAPLDSSIQVIGASSGYLVVDVSDVSGEVRVGDELGFNLNYSALLRAMTSEYVKKRVFRGGVCLDMGL